MITSTTHRNRLIGIVVAAGMVLAACGSDTDDATAAETVSVEDATTEDSTTEEQATAEDTTTEEQATAEDTTTEEQATVDASSGYMGSYTLADEEFGTMVTVTVDGDTRTIASNTLPDHETGEFPNSGNPNTISAQDASWEFTTDPVYTGDATEARTPGVAVNGVKFEPGTAETVTCGSGENYRIEALQDIYDLGLDFNNAHVQPTGEYHYHGISELLVDAYESEEDLVHVGFAADGFMMYYSKSGAFESGWELSTAVRSGTDCIASGPAGNSVNIDGSTPDGTYGSDWVYSTDAGDLDSCNGTEVDGQYVYIVTDSYPYISRCLNGEVTGQAGGAGGGGQAPPPGAGGSSGGPDQGA